MRLVLDCCALVHAKAMARLEIPPLGIIRQLAAPGHVTTPRVRGELGQSSLEATLGAWESDGVLSTEKATRQEVRELRNLLRRTDAEPGDNDKELVAVARRLSLPLLTHDGPASVLARRAGVQVLDLADVVGLAAERGLVNLEEVDAAWGSLAGYPWPWPDYPWDGSLAATLAGRG